METGSCHILPPDYSLVRLFYCRNFVRMRRHILKSGILENIKPTRRAISDSCTASIEITHRAGIASWVTLLSVDLTEYDIERADDRRNIGQHMAAAHRIDRLQMGKGWRPYLAAIWPVGAVRYQIDAEFTLWCLDWRIDLAGRNAMAFRVQLEMLDCRLHRAFHLGAQGRDDFPVFDRDRPLACGSSEFLEALLHDPDGLAHLLHANEIAIVAVAILPDGNVEIEFGIAFVRLGLAQIPGSTRPPEHDAGKSPAPGLVETDDADIDIALLEYPVLGEEAFH